MTNDAGQVTGTPDPHYNLVSVLYHALQAGQTAGQYVEDAEASGDTELAEFFREVQNSDRERAERAKLLLRSRLGETTG